MLDKLSVGDEVHTLTDTAANSDKSFLQNVSPQSFSLGFRRDFEPCKSPGKDFFKELHLKS